MDWSQRIAEFVTLWVVIDPLGTLPVFMAVTMGQNPSERRRTACLAVLISFGVLIFFVFGGHWLLQNAGVSINSFQIAGGIVLFLFALSMIHGHHLTDVNPTHDVSPADIAIYPLAIPSIASPGAMLAAVVLTDDARDNFPSRLATMAIIALVLLATLAILLGAGRLSRLIGRGGASIISRVMGMILAALAVDLVLTAVARWLSLPDI